jgi:hypothetical protein
MKTRVVLSCIATAVLAAIPLLAAQTPRATRPGGTASASILNAEQALPLTCVQAWSAAQQSYPQMRAVVITLARVSLANRGLTFPNTREAGVDAGKAIAADCKADPDALLFAIVDKHVRRVAEAAVR